MRPRAISLLGWALFGALFGLAAADTKHCYYPDGTLADSGTSPCNTTAAVSACCDPRDSCTTSGLCLGASGWIYRSSCTDQTWNSFACPSQCHTDPILNQPYSSFAPIYPCVSGLDTSEFCCGSSSGQSCCGSNFTLGNTGFAFKPGSDAIQDQISSLSAATASVASAATAASASKTADSSRSTVITTETATGTSSYNGNSRSYLGTAIGAGVGVPLGILALGLLGILIWRERRRHREFAANEQGSSGPAWSQGNSMRTGNAAGPGFAGGSPAWGGTTASQMSQFGAANLQQQQLGVHHPEQRPDYQGEPGWKDSNTLSRVEAQGHPLDVRHELQT